MFILFVTYPHGFESIHSTGIVNRRGHLIGVAQVSSFLKDYALNHNLAGQALFEIGFCYGIKLLWLLGLVCKVHI